MRRPLLLPALLAAAAVTVIVTAGVVVLAGPPAAPAPPGRYRGSEPPPGIVVPDAALHSYRGPLVSLRRPRDRVLVLTGVDSQCKETCPILAATVAAALRLLSPHDRAATRAVAYSVDPRVDTPARVERFLRRRHALALEYLVDGVDRMRPLWRKLQILSATQSGDADVHSASVRVYDRAGVWVSTLHAGVDLTAANLAHDITAALTERRPNRSDSKESG